MWPDGLMGNAVFFHWKVLHSCIQPWRLLLSTQQWIETCYKLASRLLANPYEASIDVALYPSLWFCLHVRLVVELLFQSKIINAVINWFLFEKVILQPNSNSSSTILKAILNQIFLIFLWLKNTFVWPRNALIFNVFLIFCSGQQTSK